ncbi:MAG: DEAD/DEAH box helicase [Flammeovirgaceae bacterium]|nr:DEAD/DEAH box helicase [Flammeovirgaceae bacterium]
MGKNFGKTWWGEQWLNSLANIDYSNRLPRGGTYARKGAVTTIDFEGSIINAKVKGSMPRPYKVDISIPAFTQAEKEKFISEIVKKPVVISKLLNRELDQEVLAISQKCGLKVFPKQWDDFKMNCSCPDWAVPCKHLAAVIYKVSAEIDNNPFLVFELHGLDLTKELKKKDIFISDASKSPVPKLQDLILAQEPNQKRLSKLKKDETWNNELAYEKISLSSLQPVTDPLVELLKSEPVFYQNSGDFREKYAQTLKKIVRNTQRIVQAKTSITNYFGNAEKKPYLDHHSKILVKINGLNEPGFEIDEKNVPEEYLIAELWQIPYSDLGNFQPSVAVLKNSLVLAFNLLKNGAVVPQLVQLENGFYAIRWLPATLSKTIRHLVDNLFAHLPEDILVYQNLKRKKTEFVPKTAFTLLSLWLTALIPKLGNDLRYDHFLELFFKNYPYQFSEPGEPELAGGIHQWLKRYYLSQGNYKVILTVEEKPSEDFLLHVAIKDEGENLIKPIPLHQILTLKKHEKKRFEILQLLTNLSVFIPGLDRYINSLGGLLIEMRLKQFTPFLMQAIPAIQLLDIEILLPKSLNEILKPRPSVQISKKAVNSKGYLRLDKILDFDWRIAIGDELVDEKEFKKLMKNSAGLIKYKTDYIYVAAGELEKLYQHFTSTKKMTTMEMLRVALSEEYFGAKISLTEEVQKLIKELTNFQKIPIPEGLKATLRPYQERGFSWLYRNSKIGFGSVLADDMGLGKTLQVICTLAKYKDEGILDTHKALVIAPTGLLSNWQNEFNKFAPHLKCQLFHGSNRKLGDDDYDILLTSYGVTRSDVKNLKKLKWQAVIIDEAQHIKNPGTALCKAVKSIPANTFIAMSGTPVENRLSELWSIMDFSNRSFLGSLKEFKSNYIVPVENENNAEVASKLINVTAPFLMRRLKSDKSIISDLPDKIEMDTFATLAKEQASLYEKTLHEAMNEIEGISATDHQSLFKRQGLVLQMILALKQICNHPTQFLKNKVMDSSLSGKMDLLFEKLDSIVENNEKVLLFTQFTEMGNLLKHFITEKYGDEPLFYHGGCSIKQRTEMVDNFQNNRADKIFILTLKSAGTGLNLTAANHVIHFDLWWNPAVEAQATDRAYRIGQKNNVMVHRFITKNTFEERINEMIQSKKALANITVATGEGWIGNLNNDELKALFEIN